MWRSRIQGHHIFTTALPLLLATITVSIALVSDLRSRRIPNWLTLGGFLLGMATNLLVLGPDGLLVALSGAGLGFLLLFPFYLLRGVGAGDVKLLAAVGSLLGPQMLLAAAAYGALVGGLMSLIILARRGRLGFALHQLFVMHTMPTQSGAKAPYAVAIASGTYLAAGTSVLPRVLG